MKPRSVLITGSAKGIGHACAARMDALGWRVFAGVRRAEDADALRRALSPRVTPVLLDVTDAGQRAAVAAQIESAVGSAGLDGLVNNAGIAIAGPLEFLPLEELRAQLELNVISVLGMIQALMPMLRRAHGRIVNISSVSGRSALPIVGAYAASKFALEALSDALRVELAPWRIDVAVIEPGVIATPIWDTALTRAETIADAYPAAATELYGALMDRMRARVRRSATTGNPPGAVATAVAHALTARTPRTRYVVGRDARLRLLLQKLPDRWRDRLILRKLARL